MLDSTKYSKKCLETMKLRMEMRVPHYARNRTMWEIVDLRCLIDISMIQKKKNALKVLISTFCTNFASNGS